MHGGSDPQQQHVEEMKGRQEELQNTVNQRLVEMARQIDEDKANKARQQDELFNKIKNELFQNLADNFRRVELELSNLKSSRSAYEDQIAQTIKTMGSAGNAKEKDAAQAKVE